MAEKLADYTDQSPIISDVKIASKAEGDEALAQGLGKVSDEAFKIGTDMNDAMSKAAYAATTANVEKIATDTQVQIMHDPSHAETYLKNKLLDAE
jgi:hypothetical protein